jgi:hypothetical protein
MKRGDFWSRVEKTESCWLWRGPVNRKGYGFVSRRHYGESLAHRYSWLVYKGPVPLGLCVLHRCDIAACVNPDHLFLGTKADNNTDLYAKRRFAIGEKNGQSKLTREMVAQIREAQGTQRSIAEKFGISQSGVSRIKNLQVWWL